MRYISTLKLYVEKKHADCSAQASNEKNFVFGTSTLDQVAVNSFLHTAQVF